MLKMYLNTKYFLQMFLNTKYFLQMFLNTKYFLQMSLNTKYIDVFKNYLNTFVNSCFLLFSKYRPYSFNPL